MRKLILVTVLISLAALAVAAYGHRKIRLTDVRAITLSKNKYTNGRRSSPIPQISCTHGDACGYREYEPEVVQCVNVGSDGIDVNWECKADLDSSVRFGRTDVSCEGYDYPEDPYILEGSCGLEYTLEFTELGRQKKYGHNNYNNYHNSSHHGSSSSIIGSLVSIGAFIFIAYLFISFCFSSRQVAPNANNNSGGWGGGYPGGGNPPGDGYGPGNGNQGYPKTSYTGYSHPYVPPPAPAAPGGFWTGFGTGGLLGYLFSRPSYGYGYGGYRPSYGYRPSGFGYGGSGGSSFGGSSFGGSSSRSSSGFGTTRRR